MTGWGSRLLGLGGRSLVLASASPRRAEILSLLGVPFTVRPADLDETPRAQETPEALVERLAREKALAVTWHDAVAVLAADTTVVLEGNSLGKPADDAEARVMLQSLSGRTHSVLTGVAVRLGADRVHSGVESTEVRFRALTAEDLDALVFSGEARDKAGAYGIQGLASLCVEHIQGDYLNVVGLPLGLCRRLLTHS